MIARLLPLSGTLYLVSLVLLSSVLLALCLKAIEAWREVREILNGPLNSSSNSSIIVSGTSYLPASMINRLAAIAVLSTVFALTVSVWLIFDRFGRSDLVKYENVHVLARYSPRNFCMESRGIQFSARPCQPFPDDIVPGVTLTKFWYVYDEHLNCNDWYATRRGEKAGYSTWRNPDDTPILTNFPRSASAGESCAKPESRSVPEAETTARAGR